MEERGIDFKSTQKTDGATMRDIKLKPFRKAELIKGTDSKRSVTDYDNDTPDTDRSHQLTQVRIMLICRN